MNVTSGVDWFDLAGTCDFDGMEVQSAGDPRSPPPRPELRAAGRRLAGHLAAGVAGKVSPRWPNWARRKARPSAFARRRPCCWTPCWPPRSKSPSIGSSPSSAEKLRSFDGVGAGRRAAGLHGRAAAVPERRAGLAALPARLPPRRLPGRRHGPGQDRAGAGPAASAAHAARPTARPAASLRWSSCPAAWSSTGSKRPSGSRPSCGCWTTPACSAGRPDRQLRSVRPGGHHLRHPAARHRQAQGPPLRLRHPRRVPGDQERPVAAGQGLPAAEGRSPPGHDRHARGKPPGRAVVALRVPQPGHARHGDSVFQDISKKVSEDSEGLALLRRALAPFILRRTKQQVLDRAAAKDRADAALRSGRQAAEALRRAARPTTAPCSPSGSPRPGMAKAKIHVLEALLRLRQAAMPPRPDRQGAVGRIERQARRAPGAARRGHRRGAQGPGLLAVHVVPGDRPQPARRRRSSSTSTSTAAPAQRQQRVERFQNDPALPAVPHQPQGRRARAEPDRGRLRVHSRPLVEPGGRGPGDRPGPPHRPDPARLRLPPDRPRHGRGEDRRASARRNATWPTRSSPPTATSWAG